MKLSYVLKKTKETMKILENIEFTSYTFKQNQIMVNKAYKNLDDFKGEILNEMIKNKLEKQKQK